MDVCYGKETPCYQIHLHKSRGNEWYFLQTVIDAPYSASYTFVGEQGTTEKIEFSENCLKDLIGQYTREAGLRNLERSIASVCRKVATMG